MTKVLIVTRGLPILGAKILFIFLSCLCLVGCTKKNNIGWPAKINGEVYNCLFLPENKVVLSTSAGFYCYDLDSGKREWIVEGIMAIYRPVLLKESLITGIFWEHGLYSININDGSVNKLFNIEELVHALQVQDEENILAVTQDGTKNKYLLQCFNIEDHTIEKITDLDSAPKNKFEIYGENIILPAVYSRKKDKLLIIDRIDKMIKWEDTIRDMTLLHNSDFVRIENSIYYIRNEENENYLLQIDVNSGSIIDRTFLPFLINSNYLRLNKDNILIYGRSFYYIFDTTNKQFSKTIENNGDIGYSSFVNNDNIVYDNHGIIYCYSIRDNRQRKIYNLNGNELFMMFGNSNFVILIVAKNVKSSLANDANFDLMVIKY
jgi:hypothetical protein